MPAVALTDVWTRSDACFLLVVPRGLLPLFRRDSASLTCSGTTLTWSSLLVERHEPGSHMHLGMNGYSRPCKGDAGTAAALSGLGQRRFFRLLTSFHNRSISFYR